MAKHRSRPTRRKYSKIAMGLEALEMKVAVQNARITGLEEQMAQVRRGKKRKAVPNPNQRFVALSENLAAGEALPDSKEAEIEVDVDEEVESVIEVVLDGTLYRDTGVPTARVALEDAKHRFGLRIQAVHKDHPLAARAQREMWKKRFHNRRPAGALKPPQTRLQRASMLQATFPRPRQALGKRLTAAVSVTNNRNKKEAAKEFQQWQKDLPDTHLVAFSDGSQDEKGAVGWGYAIYRDGRKIVQGKGRLGIAEVFDGEAEGARNALKRACQIDAGAQIHICIDNTSVIAGLLGDAPTSSQEAFLEFQEIAQAVAVNVR
ncbi:hypothetical protein FPOA_13641 [Fusarium poae]|nr:hypothetical protein FPOA_13641 [Fusarium poae]